MELVNGQSRYRDYQHRCQYCQNMNTVTVDLTKLSDLHFGWKNKQMQAESQQPKRVYPYVCQFCGRPNQMPLS
jgi:hypothetical protein